MSNAFWEEIKKMFKSKQTLNEEESQAVNEAVKNESGLVQALKQLEEEYLASVKKEETDVNALFPETLGLEKVEYKGKSDEELSKQAADELASTYYKKISDIDASAVEKAAAIEDKKTSAGENTEMSLKDIEKLYAALKDGAEKDAIKRGLGRSSIITERLKDYDISKAQSAVEIKDSYDKSIAGLNDQLDKLSAEKEKAFESLDLSYAADLTKRISALTSERDKLAAAAVEANNKTAKQEADYQTERLKSIEKYYTEQAKAEKTAAEQLAAYEKENGYSGEKQENYSKRYDLALDFYMSLAPDVAPKALEASSNMKYYLGNYYDKLADVLKDRASTTNRYSN